jgi:CubicO group peptidase (beta-lactamase class C family)
VIAGVGIDGSCDRRFEPVRAAFADNFTERGEQGAAVCVAVGGRVVVDLWGGLADREGRPWQADTLVDVFSVGKGMLAALVAALVGEGELDPDARVAQDWPAFAAAGKQDVTVRHLLTHQAGLPAVRQPLPDDVIYDWDAMTGALAATEPWWPPGTAHGYHVNTFGFLVGEVVRRATGRSPGRLLAERIAGPLRADVLLGVPPAQDHRVAEFTWPELTGELRVPDGPEPDGGPIGGPDDDAHDPDAARRHDLQHLAYFNPPTISGMGVVNTRAWRAAEMPSTNTHASARGIARVYQALAAGGTLDGVRIVDRVALAASTTEQVAGEDLVLGRPSRFGLGFQLTQPERPLGPNPTSFGHFGAGGSLGFCDPTAGVAFGYVMNELGARWQNPRNRALVDAVYQALGGT